MSQSLSVGLVLLGTCSGLRVRPAGRAWAKASSAAMAVALGRVCIALHLFLPGLGVC